MIRHCDGTDPNLTRPVREGDTPEQIAATPWDGVPCDCGRTFDDVDRMVIYPHNRV